MPHHTGWKTWAGWAIAVTASLGVFALYTRPEFLVTLADQVWSCF